MMPTYNPARISDIPVIVGMMRQFYAIDGYPMDPDLSAGLLATFIADETLGKIWLITIDNECIGYIILTFVFSFEYHGRIAFLDELYIVEASRGKGIGKSALAFVKEQAAVFSLKLIYLEVENHNANALHLYLSSGFEMHNRKFLRYRTSK